LVHPFNDPLVIAGHGTIGQEILAQSTRENIDAVFCCVGGGGLLAGVGVFLKAVKPSIRVIGVEAEDSAAMTRSLEAGQIVELPSVGLFADGAAVRRVGEETFRLCKDVVDEMITVSTDEICGAIKSSFIDTRVVLEPAGALAAAGLKKYAEKTGISGQTFVAVTSGANMDFDRLRFVSERADTSESLIAIWIPEKPGSFLRLYECIYPRNVTEFSYRISGDPASIFLSFQASCTEDRKDVLERLTQSGFQTLDLSSSDLAKTHGRHLVGGGAPQVSQWMRLSSNSSSLKHLVRFFDF
jgi:threonine dehydratase